jgi:DNA-directed RNA polymerase subunit N (RpoN/RPB10)
MGFFKKKCFSCKKKIEKGKEVFADIKVTYLKGIHNRAFCGKKCVEAYKEYERNMPNVPNTCPSCPP